MKTIEFVSEKQNFVPFHIPLQSGSNEILKLMKVVTNVKYIERVKIREVMPHACIGVM
jgi:threonylcarbamoyladenosine tRNA methylthiotransferase MtaB